MIRYRTLLLAISLAVGPGWLSGAAKAAWPRDPGLDLQVSPSASTPGERFNTSQVAPDGSGGAIVAWHHGLADSYDYVALQHVTRLGVRDPAWSSSGVPAGQSNGATAPHLIPDGAGGAIVVWENTGVLTNGLFVQHVQAAGRVDPAWPADGVKLASTFLAGSSRIASDGAGGALVTWSTNDIYAQHVKSTGLIDPLWPAAGRVLCAATGSQTGPQIVADGLGGAVVAWQDARSGAWFIAAQRVSNGGSVYWAADGMTVTSGAQDRLAPQIVGDGSAGAILTWQDYRAGATADIYAQHVQGAGTVDPAWPVGGRALCAASGDQLVPQIVSDGAAGAIVAWQDRRGGSWDIYAQHVKSNGAVDPAWTADGVAACTATGDQTLPRIAPDGTGGVVAAWQDLRNGNLDIYAQHIQSAGTRDSWWPSNEDSVCTAGRDQTDVQICPDGFGGVCAVWSDARSGGPPNSGRIFAERVDLSGGYRGNPAPRILSVLDVPADQGGNVNVTWEQSYLDAPPDFTFLVYKVYRRGPGSTWANVGTRPAVMGATYSLVVPTLADSVSGSPNNATFLVRANLDLTPLLWNSFAESGYSVDNLPPAMPRSFTGQYFGALTALHWRRNPEADLATYALYRGADTTFVPGPGNLAYQGTDTSYADNVAGGHCYKVAAQDVHGNGSAYALLTPAQAGDVPGDGSPQLWLGPAAPNPMRDVTAIRYSLPRAGAATLEILDIHGARVRVLVSGRRASGASTASWDGRDDRGRSVAAGIYFCRLSCRGGTRLRKVVAVR